jgi:hypothetical protein
MFKFSLCFIDFDFFCSYKSHNSMYYVPRLKSAFNLTTVDDMSSFKFPFNLTSMDYVSSTEIKVQFSWSF